MFFGFAEILIMLSDLSVDDATEELDGRSLGDHARKAAIV
jgi:hypothetical protein